MASWREIAQEKRAAEDHLIERYRAKVFRDDLPRSEGDDRVITTPWGLGHRFHREFYITHFARRSAWPETQLVLDLFWQAHEDRRFVVMQNIWPPDHIYDPEPPYNDLFYVNLWESLVSRAVRWLKVQPGPLVYFIWSNEADLNNPPATGDPPAELLAARQETVSIKSQWLTSGAEQ